MATGTAAMAPMHTVRRMSAVRGDVDQRIEAIGKEAEAEPQSVVGMPTGAQLPADPFASLQRVAGWAIDYVAFLREPLVQLEGDPQSVQAVVDAIRSTAERMRELAKAQHETLARPQGWTGSAKDAYQASMEALGEEFASLANAVDKKGVVVEYTGAMVQALREALLYTIGQYSDSLVPGAISAYVFAPFTAGASIPMFLMSVVDSAAQLGTSIAAKMDDLNAALTRQVGRAKELDRICDEVGGRWERFESAAGGETATARADNLVKRMSVGEERVALRPAAFSRAEEPLQARHAVREQVVHARYAEAEPMMQARHAVQAEPEMAVRHAVRAEPAMLARSAVQAEPEMAMRAQMQAEPAMAVRQAVQAEPAMAVRQAVQAEPAMAVRSAVQAEPEMVVRNRVEAEPEMVVRSAVRAEPAMVVRNPVQAEPMRAVHRVVETE